jgi:uncharacterized protein GlcG (DUF336 family)
MKGNKETKVSLTLKQAKKIGDVALKFANENNFKPLGIVVIDNRGVTKYQVIEDNTSLHRQSIAHAKAYGAVSMGVGTRGLAKMAADRPAFIEAAGNVIGKLVPVAGGVLIRDKKGVVLGAIGISGDTSDNDELAGVNGIEAAGLVADAG